MLVDQPGLLSTSYPWKFLSWFEVLFWPIRLLYLLQLYSNEYLIVETEFQRWLLWYSLPILKGILPEPYYSHYAGLVAGIGLLLKVPISRVNFQIAERLITIFVAKSLIYMVGRNSIIIIIIIMCHIALHMHAHNNYVFKLLWWLCINTRWHCC